MLSRRPGVLSLSGLDLPLGGLGAMPDTVAGAAPAVRGDYRQFSFLPCGRHQRRFSRPVVDPWPTEECPAEDHCSDRCAGALR
jgi:hypothetical protein